MIEPEARFSPGTLIRHRLFDYRGVVYDVDPVFMGTEDWYQQVARSRPPKDRPWYHVLVDEAAHTTYVAERNLVADEGGRPITHALLQTFFARFENATGMSNFSARAR